MNQPDTEKKGSKKLDVKQLKRVYGIFKYIRPYRLSFYLGLLLLTLSSLVFMVFPGAGGEMANAAVGKSRFENFEVRDYALLFLVLLVLQGLFSYLRTILFSIVSEKGMADVRKALYEKLITQPVQFFEERRIGEIASRITTDVEQLQNAFSVTLAEFVRQFVVLLAGIGIIAWLTPKLSLVMLATFPIVVVSAIFFGRFIRGYSKKRQDELASTNIVVEETLQNFQVVKSFANEWFEAHRYGTSVDKVVSTSLRFARYRGLFFVFIITILFGAIFFILWQGALMVQRGDMEVGDLFSFILYTGIIGGSIAGIGNLYTTLMSAVGATERILDILNTESETNTDRPVKNAPPLKGKVAFDNLTFTYPTRPDIKVLKDFSMTINPGEKVALVGASGAGKSTILQLLLRYYKDYEGAILVDDNDVKNFDLRHYRGNIGLVPQEVLLFGGSIRENILYGNPDATEDMIIEAAKQSNAWEFITQFPEGLDTLVGDRGVKLSGGQRQRLAIARVILKNPSILLLDEATSALDASSEKLVQEALNRLMENRTAIIVAHRLATIKDVDCIYVIDNGKVIEKGNHATLASKENGAYSSLAKLQFEMT